MKYTKEIVEEAVKNSTNLTECLLFIGKAVSGCNVRYIRHKIHQYNIDISHFTFKSRTPKYNYNKLLGSKKLKGILLKNNVECKCSICGQGPYWNNIELTLQVDHIDGDRENNELTNLRFICPNCHTQTKTYCGRNVKYRTSKYTCVCGSKKSWSASRCLMCYKKNIKQSIKITSIKPERPQKNVKIKYDECECGNIKYYKSKKCKHCHNKLPKCHCRKVIRPSKEELLQLIKTTPFTQIGKYYNVSDNAVRKWCKYYELPFRKKDLKD